jgi:hypothetical protein
MATTVVATTKIAVTAVTALTIVVTVSAAVMMVVACARDMGSKNNNTLFPLLRPVAHLPKWTLFGR